MATLQQEARVLGDPTRHTIFRFVATSDAPVDIAALTEVLGLHHNAIRQHLAKLLDAGLVVEHTAPAGRPGRPRLLYRLAPGVDSRWGVTGPYERLSVLLAEVVRTGASPEEVGRRAGRTRRSDPIRATDPLAELVDVMADQGFDPELRQRGARAELVLRTCPFATTALADPDTVCALHLGIAEGATEGTEVAVDELVRKHPLSAGCRLRVHREAAT